MMKVFEDTGGKGVALDLTKVEAVLELDDGQLLLVTSADTTYTVKGDFDCITKAVEHEKDARCV